METTTPDGKTRRPAVEGWFTVDDAPHLIGSRCPACGTYAFPPAARGCPNPACRSQAMDTVPLSTRGTVWSFTDNRYQPPAPYISPDPFVPYTVAAVELATEKLVVLGQVDGDPSALTVGAPAELVLAPLYEDDDAEYVVWKWRAVEEHA
jgi:uncharacterized OB-fold protein